MKTAASRWFETAGGRAMAARDLVDLLDATTSPIWTRTPVDASMLTVLTTPKEPVLADTTFIVGALACGGSRSGPNCIGEVVGPAGSQPVTCSMRGSAYGEAYMVSPSEIDAVWFTSRLIGDIPGLGRALFTTRPDAQSHVTITTGRMGWRGVLLRLMWRSNRSFRSEASRQRFFQGAGGAVVRRALNWLFFPAFASQDMFYDIQIFDSAGQPTQRLRSGEPMIFEAEIQSIPPLGTTFRTTMDVDFADVGSGANLFRMLAGAPGLVDEAPGFTMELTRRTLDTDAGTFEGVVTIRATKATPVTVCWFATPTLGATLTSTDSGIDVPFGESIEIPIGASLGAAEERAGFVVQCFSSEGEPIEIHQAFLFAEL